MSARPPPRLAEWMFALCALGIGVLLATRVGAELSWQRGQALIRQPGFWPVLAIAGMVLFGLGHVWQLWRRPQTGTRLAPWPEIGLWIRSVEFVLWFVFPTFPAL